MYATLLIVTHAVLAANNRGEGSGNTQTLQKITTPTGTRTVVSGYAIKRALRDNMTALGARMWRTCDDSDPKKNPAGYVYGDNKSPSMAEAKPPTPEGFADSVFGFMRAEKGKGEQVVKQKGFVEVSAAVSTTNYDGDIAFAQGLKVAEPLLNPFGLERHYTRYSFTITFDLDHVSRENLQLIVASLGSLAVGGNHSSHASELTIDKGIFAIHKTPGRAGLQCGLSLSFPPDNEIDLSPIEAKAKDLGVFEQLKSGEGGSLLREFSDCCAPFCGA